MTTTPDTTSKVLAAAFKAGVMSLPQLAAMIAIRDLSDVGSKVNRTDIENECAPMDCQIIRKALPKLVERGLVLRIPQRRDEFWCRFHYVLSPAGRILVDGLP